MSSLYTRFTSLRIITYRNEDPSTVDVTTKPHQDGTGRAPTCLQLGVLMTDCISFLINRKRDKEYTAAALSLSMARNIAHNRPISGCT